MFTLHVLDDSLLVPAAVCGRKAVPCACAALPVLDADACVASPVPASPELVCLHIASPVPALPVPVFACALRCLCLRLAVLDH